MKWGGVFEVLWKLHGTILILIATFTASDLQKSICSSFTLKELCNYIKYALAFLKGT